MSEKETLRKVLLTYPRDELKKVIASSNITNIAKFSKPQLIEIMLKFSERFKDIKPFGKKSEPAKKVSKKSSPASLPSPPKVSQILPPNYLENLKKAPKLSTKDKPLQKKETTEEIMNGWDGVDTAIRWDMYGAYDRAWWWFWALYGIYIKDRAYGFLFTSILSLVWIDGLSRIGSPDAFIAFVQNFVSEGKYARYPVTMERMNNARMILGVEQTLTELQEDKYAYDINTEFPTFTVDGSVFTEEEYTKVPDTRSYTFPTFDGDRNIPIIRKEIEASGLKLNDDDDLDMDLTEFEMNNYLGFENADFSNRVLAWNKVGESNVEYTSGYITGYTKQFGKEVMMDEDISLLSQEYLRELGKLEIPASLQQKEFTIPDWFSKWLDVPNTVTVNKTGLTELRALLKFKDDETNAKQLKQLGIAKKIKTFSKGRTEVDEFNENGGLSVVTQPTYSSGEKTIRLPAQRKKTI